ncbi:thioredoxin-like protein [Diplogelasinospora grovesii]|uniref:Thioredoxin-like protein n=1 Tax=Diplogelasinospora grovesii TaxID=303347 RepID=A0AAN6N5A4_9PEZI|nr:thioredoxin-like protein [Diplogelasinospora grovesii]
MFRFHKTLDIITLFHKANSPASMRVAALLKQVSALCSTSATEDQASDHSAQAELERRDPFELNITEEPPTPDQLQTILDYVGPKGIPSIIKGAADKKEALKKFQENADNFQRPVVVDWNNGKAIAGDNKSAILKMLNVLPKNQ